MSIRYAIIMAAGRGTRLIPYTLDVPKAMIPHNESTLIANSISNIKKHIDCLYITVGYKKAMLARHVIEEGASAIFNTEGKGNAWWIYNTLIKYLDEPLFVLTCDNVTEIDFEQLANDYRQKKCPTCMLIPIAPIKGVEGDYIFRDQNVVTHLSRTKESDIYCSGIQILNPFKINQITKKTEDFGELWSQLMERKELFCSDIQPKKWYTVDTPEQLKVIDTLVRQGAF